MESIWRNGRKEMNGFDEEKKDFYLFFSFDKHWI